MARGTVPGRTPTPAVEAEATRLEECRLEAVDARIEADLRCGRHASVLGELEALTAEHPFREDLRGRQMLALYRSGRQADALAAYRDLRGALADELGVEPTPALQRLHQRILTADETLMPPERAAEGAASSSGSGTPAAPPRATRTPAAPASSRPPAPRSPGATAKSQ
ncbi:BTAD domain-containing putative transcriptional regulator [Streptomyces sp. FXJ1.4098]|nr:BTAD domain-containing putative transcriptional regulator [Streptomyces sp. FXJ1.4098]